MLYLQLLNIELFASTYKSVCLSHVEIGLYLKAKHLGLVIENLCLTYVVLPNVHAFQLLISL